MKQLFWLRSALILSAIIIGAWWGTTSASAQTMVGLGVLPGDTSSGASGVSADGSVVVGNSYSAVSNTNAAFKWTASTGMVGLGFLPGYANSLATGISADGSTIVGYDFNDFYVGPENFFQLQAFVWTADTGLIGLGMLPGYASSAALGISADGSTIVGVCLTVDNGSFVQQQAFRWTAATGMVGLGYLPNGVFSEATGVSADGSIVVGSSYNNVRGEAFVWTASAGMVGLGQVPGDFLSTNATGVSSDSSTVIGIRYGISSEAFAWTAGNGMIGLGYLPGDSRSFPGGTSANGSTIVGSSSNDQDHLEAFAWTNATGMMGLGYLPGDSVSASYSISADGSTIVGFSGSAQRGEAFLLRLNVGPTDLVNALIHKVVLLNLHHGIQKSLTAKLEAALKAIDQANNHSHATAVKQLNAFIKEVQAQSGKRIPIVDADALIAAALRVIDLLHA